MKRRKRKKKNYYHFIPKTNVKFYSSILSNSDTLFIHFADQHKEEVSMGNLKRFSFRELQIATNNFSSKNILGKGGFGNVYKGQLPDGTLIAVKRLKDGNAAGGEIQFQTEVEMISLAVHRNLLRLCGFCMTTTERLLVYPYMSNGSVASRLKGMLNGIIFQFSFFFSLQITIQIRL